MADHINVHSPQARESHWQAVALAKTKAELELLQDRYDALASDLDAIFTRIKRGDQVELHYPDGEIIVVTKARKRGGADAEPETN